MPTLASVHTALDQATAAAFTGYPVVYKNQKAPKTAESFIKQLVLFTSNKQYQLGDTANGRQTGKLLFLFHVKRGIGSSLANTWHDILITSFRSKLIGGAVLQNVISYAGGETENYDISVVEVSFYFDS